MTLSNKTLQSIENLDFDTIKEDLKLYLSNQDTFKDYDFEGSGMSILLDVLAYNTHHMGFYANMLANEAFLDSCVLRSSAVSLAKSLGYYPRSRRGSEITVDVFIKPNVPNEQNTSTLITLANSRILKVLQNELFSTSFNNKNYYFYSSETRYFNYEGKDESGNDIIVARDVILREGKIKTETYIVNKNIENQKFIISDSNIDDRSVTVFVKKSINESEGVLEPWKKSTNIVENEINSNVFFLQESYGGNFELYFGDGVLGKNLENGNIILVTYAICSGEDGNGIGVNDDPPSNPSFVYLRNQSDADPIPIVKEVRVKKNSRGRPIVAAGGQERETRDSIKYYAPKVYETQDRAVTLNDYIVLLQQSYSGSIKSIHAWGGEDNDPPEYGKVFISVRPVIGFFLTTQEKINLEKNILSGRNVVTVTPKIKDPEYIFITPRVNLKYKENELGFSSSVIEDIAMSYIKNYGIENLSAFEKNFYSGQMIKNLLEINTALKSCTIDISFYKKFTPIFNSKFTYSVSFENKLTELSANNYISSSTFLTFGKGENSLNLPSVAAYFKDNGRGKISLYQRSDDTLLAENYGTINYETGKIDLKSSTFLLPSSLEAYEITIFAKPFDEDIFSKRNTILEIDPENINVSLTPITTTRI